MKYFLLAAICLCIGLQAKAQVLRLQFPYMNVSQGWQTSKWDQASENRIRRKQVLGLFEVAATVKGRFTLDASYQLESIDPDYMSLPAYLEQADINLPDRRTLSTGLSPGTTYKYSSSDRSYRAGHLKLGLAKNWWFDKWTLDLGGRYIMYVSSDTMGTSDIFSSGERLYRLDRWTGFGVLLLEGYVRPTLLLGERVSLSAHLSWMLQRADHGIQITRLSGLNVPWEQYSSGTASNEHFLFLGLGLHYTPHFKKE